MTAFSKKRIVLIVAALVAIVAAAVVVGSKWVGEPPEQPRDTAIIQLVPSDADTFIAAPFTGEWWSKVAAFDDPGKGLMSIDPSTAPASIATIGYSRSADTAERELPMAGPLRVFYLEMSTEEDASKVAAWLGESSSRSGFVIHQHGTVLALTAMWVAEFSAPKSPLSKVSGFAPALTNHRGAMWMNPEKEAASLTTATTAGPYSRMATSIFGFTSGTTWMGTSTDGSSWSGPFTNGGVDPSKLDLAGAEKTLRSTETVISSIGGPMTKTQIILPGLSEILSSTSFEHGESSVGADIHATDHPSVNTPLVTVVNDVTDWEASIREVRGVRENIGTRFISANENDMTVSFTFEAAK